MKKSIPSSKFTTSIGSLLAVVAAGGLVLCGGVASAQPTITGAVLPNAPNNANGFGIGAVQFQGAVPPASNVLSFQVSSSTGVTALTVNLTGETLPGVTTSTLLTPTFGLSVSGASTSETVLVPLSGDNVYSAVISATDSSGTTSSTVSFDTINPNYFTFEAEDFDYGGGLYYDSLPAGTFPNIDAYYQLAAVTNIDCNNHSGGSPTYRPDPLATETTSDTHRIQYYTSGAPDYDVGFNNGGDWGNYTRHYPPGVYNIYLRGSGGSVKANAATIGMVTSGYGTTNQTTNHIGAFSVLGLGYQSFTWCPAIDTNGNLAAWGAGGDQETLRFTVAGGSCNEQFYMLVPAVPVVTPNNTNVFQGNPATLSVAPYALTNPTVQWQTDGGTGGKTWTIITGATNTTYSVVASNLSVKPYQYQVAFMVPSNGVSVSVTSGVVTLNILAPSKPAVVENTYPASATALTGTSTSFTASFTGPQPITYQWLVSSNNGTTFTTIAGATNTTLVVLNLSAFTNEYELQASNALGTTTTTPATLTTTLAPPPPPLQLAGDLVAELRSVDLVGAGTTWTNRAGSAASVSNFQRTGKGALNVSNNTVNPGTPLWGAYAVNGLYVNSSGTAVQSALLAPAEISTNGTSSGEAWIYATAISGNNTVIGYGVQGQSTHPEQDREMNWGTGSGCFSGDFGSLDCAWPSPDPVTGAWEYLAWTWDGTNAIGYLNGVQAVHHTLSSSTTFSGYPLETEDTVIGVGAALGSGPNIGVDNFGGGWIASVRLSSGVLTASQVSNNFAAGLLAVVPVTVYAPTVTPTNFIAVGSSVTLNGSFTTNASLTFTYQWQTDNGSGGTNWTIIPNATNLNYVLNTTGLTPGNYEYEVILSNSANALVTISSPITITVVAATPPTITVNTTPTNITAYVTQTNTFSATFGGEPPLTVQWQISGNDVNWTNTGITTSTITVASEVPVTNWYRLTATNPLGTNVSAAAELIVLAAPALPPYTPLQTAGDIIMNLQCADLSSTSDTWTNVTSSSNSVGNFNGALLGGSSLNLSTGAPYLYHRIPTLFINQQLTNGLQSALLAPSEILGNNPVSAEAWIYATAVNEQNSCAIAYGIQGGSGEPEADREFNYCNQGSGAVSGDFGNYDTRWATTPAPGAWHYLAWTYNGTTVSCYLDGQLNVQNSPNPLITPATIVCVGGGLANSGPNLSADPFQGFIAAARLESGILTASQIATNFAAGLLGEVPATVYTPSESPATISNLVYQGETVTLGLVDRETTTFTYQWITDNASGGTTWANASGTSTGTNYALNVSSLTAGSTYQYAIVLSNTTYSLSITSPVVTLVVKAASVPVISEQPTPATNNAYVGQVVTFTAAFTGDAPITNQWQFSANGTTFTSIPGATNTTLTLSNLQLTNTGSYRITASNSQGVGSPSAVAALTVTAPPNVGFSYNAGSLSLSWTGSGTLLEATSLAGPWTAVATTSPYVVTPASAGPALFFKVNYGQ